MNSFSARFEGDKELQGDIRRSVDETPRALDEALEDWGKPTLAKAMAVAPRLTGELAGSGSLRVRGGKGELIFDAEHAPVLDLAGRGKYESLVDRYGPPPRFGYGTVLDELDGLEKVADKHLEAPITLKGWAK